MSRIQPLRGWRYDLAAAGASDLNELLAPPYDVIDPAQQAAFYQRHPHNIIRLILGQDEAGDDDQSNRYRRAAATLAQWQAGGVLRREAAPALYLLREHFDPEPGRFLYGGAATRSGILARLRLAPWGQGILPHERTFPTAKADRLALTIAAQAHFSPIFALYSDPAGQALAPLLEQAQRPADAEYADDQGVRRQLWAIADPQAIRAATARLENRTFYIADGHHRYETGLNYQRWRRGGPLPDAPPPAPLSAWSALPGLQPHPAPGPQAPQPYDHVWAYLAAMEDPGVEILPTHRCLHDVAGFDAETLLAGLARHFDLTPFADDEALLAALGQARSGDHSYALILPGPSPAYLLSLRSPASASTDHPAVAAIDVATLQTLILEPLLGIGREAAAQKRHLTTMPGARTALARTRAGDFQAAFLVKPTTLSQLRAVADAGQVTPPKATYFYPKLPSGLAINGLD